MPERVRWRATEAVAEMAQRRFEEESGSLVAAAAPTIPRWPEGHGIPRWSPSPAGEPALRVLRVHDGEEALLVEREWFDIVLLNASLPGMSGFEVCRELRRRGDVPVVFLSALSTLPDRLLAFDAGADDYIVLPADPADVACRLRAVLRCVRPPASRDVLLGPQAVTVDVRAHELRVGDPLVTTTPREFYLLRLLLERRGEVLNWDVISTRVGGYETFGSLNFVEAQVSRLRAPSERSPPSAASGT